MPLSYDNNNYDNKLIDFERNITISKGSLSHEEK